jgi:hypothetical protein
VTELRQLAEAPSKNMARRRPTLAFELESFAVLGVWAHQESAQDSAFGSSLELEFGAGP